MEKVLLSVIAASGLCAVLSHAVRQFHFVYDQKNMTDARSYCREKYIDLATIDGMKDMNTLNKLVNVSKMVSQNNHGAWIGLYDDLNSWRWSLSNSSFYTAGEAGFRNWSPGEPDNADNGESCTQMYDYGPWSDVPCYWNRSAVCTSVSGSTATFVFINIGMTWTQAQSYCRSHYTDLASVRNVAEIQAIRALLPSGGAAWIGLFRDFWKWVDGSKSSFTYWSTGEPNGNTDNCAVADFDNYGKWGDWSCSLSKAFICYSELVPVSQKVVRVRLMKQISSLDLNDPAVMEDLLNKFKQKLKDQGVNANITLSWKKQPDGKTFHKEKEKETKKNDTRTCFIKKDEP